MPMIRTEKLTRRFGTMAAVNALDLEVNEGELFGLVGPDGAGKTTTMRLLSGVMDPSEGQAWVDGKHVVRESEALKRHIGYMSQQFGLYADLTVIENIHFYADIYGVSRKERAKNIERLLGFSNLTPFQRRLAGNLSGGMKQKLGLACALIHTPRVLLLDEPTNGVDPVSRRDFWRILHSLLREGVTVFVSTAYLDEAERCNRVALLHEGKLIASGTPDAIKQTLPGALLEAQCPEPRRLASALRAALPSKPIGVFGDRVHLFTRDTSADAALVKQLCAAEGLALGSLGPAEPLLEDVFVAMIQEKQDATDA